METLLRYVSGCAAALASMLAPVAPLVAAAVGFIAVDFVSGVMASRAVARRQGKRWYFESRQAWRTVAKLGFVAVAIVMAWIIDCHILGFMHLEIAKLFTGFTCGVELWSFLENAAEVSRSPLFERLGRLVHHRLEREEGADDE